MRQVRVGGTARYVDGIRHGDMIYLAGQVARDISGDVADQTRQILISIDGLLSKLGTDKCLLLAATVYLRDIATLSEFNGVWEDWIDTNAKPTRTVVEARLGRPEYHVEITAVAAA